MTAKYRGARPGRLTAVSSRAADSRAPHTDHKTGHKSVQSLDGSHAGHALAEPELHVPAFLLASPPTPALRKAREELIAEAAYLRAASRGFVPGHELDDWLAAEKMVDARLADEDKR